MRLSRWRACAAVVTTVAVCSAVFVALGGATSPSPADLTSIAAMTKAPGVDPPITLSPELQQIRWAEGSMAVENPEAGVVARYGYIDDGLPLVPLPTAPTVEAQKTEPDKNTYLVFAKGLKGADSHYRYGTHFLFQGHEAGAPGYLTRINLDADPAHRVTLLATHEAAGAPIHGTIDGSTWNPFNNRLLFTIEAGNAGFVYQSTAEPPAKVESLAPWIGRGGYEGIQNDDRGNLYIAEDVGGAVGTGANSTARRPNSFVFRFVPKDPADLRKGGKIQALQVFDTNGDPITWGTSLTADQAIFTQGTKDIHTCGLNLRTNWLTIATTDAGSTAPGPDTNALARAQGATPFKRPENGLFRPGSDFREFIFDETGDTNATTAAAPGYGGFGAVQKLLQDPRSDAGRLRLVYNGDVEHTGLDNNAFFDRDHIAFVEDGGDTLHTQRGKLDSAYMFDLDRNYCGTGRQPVRFIAQGRDPSATIDSAGGGFGHNDGDNELTGIHVSDGDTSKGGILGERNPKAFDPDGRWRAFYTQQHGDNVTYELIPSPALRRGN